MIIWLALYSIRYTRARWKIPSLSYNWYETREKRSLGMDPDKIRCHHYTMIILSWSQPMIPWTIGRIWGQLKGYLLYIYLHTATEFRESKTTGVNQKLSVNTLVFISLLLQLMSTTILTDSFQFLSILSRHSTLCCSLWITKCELKANMRIV